MSDLSDKMLFLQSPEIYAAVYAMADIAGRRYGTREELFDDLIRFFAQYDRARTDQVERLKAQLVDALQWSVKPMRTGVVE